MSGYILLARKIYDSAIWTDDPHILKLFIYLCGKARHQTKPKEFNGFNIKRGELITSLSIISEDNPYLKRGRVQFWSRQRVSRMLGKLNEYEYINILPDTYGTHIKVSNYESYQSPESYRADTSGTPAEQVRTSTVTGADIYNKEKNERIIEERDPFNTPGEKIQPLISFSDFFLKNMPDRFVDVRSFRLNSAVVGWKMDFNRAELEYHFLSMCQWLETDTKGLKRKDIIATFRNWLNNEKKRRNENPTINESDPEPPEFITGEMDWETNTMSKVPNPAHAAYLKRKRER